MAIPAILAAIGKAAMAAGKQVAKGAAKGKAAKGLLAAAETGAGGGALAPAAASQVGPYGGLLSSGGGGLQNLPQQTLPPQQNMLPGRPGPAAASPAGMMPPTMGPGTQQGGARIPTGGRLPGAPPGGPPQMQQQQMGVMGRIGRMIGAPNYQKPQAFMSIFSPEMGASLEQSTPYQKYMMLKQYQQGQRQRPGIRTKQLEGGMNQEMVYNPETRMEQPYGDPTHRKSMSGGERTASQRYWKGVNAIEDEDEFRKAYIRSRGMSFMDLFPDATKQKPNVTSPSGQEFEFRP